MEELLRDAKCGREIGKMMKKKKLMDKKNAFSPPRSPKSPVGELRFETKEFEERKEPDQFRFE